MNPWDPLPMFLLMDETYAEMSALTFVDNEHVLHY